MSIMDANLLFRDGSVALNANELTPTSKDFGGKDSSPLTYVVVVPAAPTGSTPTLDITIQESDDDTNFRDTLSFEKIAARGKLFITGKLDGRYRRHTATLGGSTPNFGAVIIAQVIGGSDVHF